MKIKRRNKNKAAQTTLAYIIFIIVLIGAFTALMPKLRQRTQASYKDSADVFGEGRLAGSPNTSGGVAPFEFPELPGGQTVNVEDPNPDDIKCDLSKLNSLMTTSLQKQQEATKLSEEAGVARQETANAQQIAEEAREVARIAREEATQARQAATRARQAANNKKANCDSCNAGNQGCTSNCTNCTSICAEAANLIALASTMEGIAAEKEITANNKEAIYQEKQATADELNRIATGKEQAAAAAAAEAEAAAEALRKMSEACAGGGGGGGGEGGGCFLKGTRVVLVDGTNKPIEEIKIGDMIFGYDGKEIKSAKVVKTFLHPKTKGYRVISTEKGQQIKVTDIHPLFNGKTYVASSKFKVGDSLFLLKDNKLQAVKIKSIEIKDSLNDVYDLKVDKLHSYFAEGILCHNKPPNQNQLQN